MEKLRSFVKEIRERDLTPVRRNEKTWLLYECANQINSHNLDDWGVTIIDLAEVIIDEIDMNPFGKEESNSVHNDEKKKFEHGRVIVPPSREEDLLNQVLLLQNSNAELTKNLKVFKDLYNEYLQSTVKYRSAFVAVMEEIQK